MKKKNEDVKKIIVSCIADYVGQHGFAPSVRDICRLCGYKSPASVHKYIKQLEEDGILSHESSKARALVIYRSSGENKKDKGGTKK